MHSMEACFYEAAVHTAVSTSARFKTGFGNVADQAAGARDCVNGGFMSPGFPAAVNIVAFTFD